jgi:hypothetical protein
MKTIHSCIFSLLLTLSSCFTTEHIPNKYLISKVSEVPCDTFIDSPVVFFTYIQGEKIDFDYQPISLMTFSNGNKGVHSDILFEMKESARRQCADGIINLSQDMAEGKYKVSEDFTLDNNRNREIEYFTYDIRKFTGTAVKLKNKDYSKVRIDSFYLKQKFILSEQIRNDSLNRIAQEKLLAQNFNGNKGGVFIAAIFLAAIGALYISLISK